MIKKTVSFLKSSRIGPFFNFTILLIKSFFLLLRYPGDFRYWVAVVVFVYNEFNLKSFFKFKEAFFCIFNNYIMLSIHNRHDNIVGFIDSMKFSLKIIQNRKDFISDDFQKYELVVGVIFKNESHILREWIEHYIFHGVDHFYMINDGSTDDFLVILKPYMDSGLVTLFSSDGFPVLPDRQFLIYNLFFRNLSRSAKWIAIVDMDEFLYSPVSIDLKKILKKYEDFSQVVVTWTMFTSNGLEKQPLSVVQGFDKVMLKPPFSGSYYKSIVKGLDVYCFFIHKHEVTGKTKYLLNLSNNEAGLFLNHYYLQSKEYWKNKKIKFGNGDAGSYNWDLFNKFDVGDVEDLRLYEQNKEIIEKLKFQ